MPFKRVKYWASRINRWFKLRGFIILKSSNNRYHVVFDRKVSWKSNVKIIGWACLQSKHDGLTGYFILQCIKQGSTLRISSKKEKQPPRMVYHHGKQDQQIKGFLCYRRFVQVMSRRLRWPRTKKQLWWRGPGGAGLAEAPGHCAYVSHVDFAVIVDVTHEIPSWTNGRPIDGSVACSCRADVAHVDFPVIVDVERQAVGRPRECCFIQSLRHVVPLSNISSIDSWVGWIVVPAADPIALEVTANR